MRARPRVVPYWRKVWKMYSVHALAVLGGLVEIADWIPIGREFVPWRLDLAIMVLGIIGLMIPQAKDDESKG